MKATHSLWGVAQTLRQSLSIWLTQRWSGAIEIFRQGVSTWFIKRKRTSALATPRDLNEIVHRVLVVGLLISTVLMLIGLVMDLLLYHTLPTTVFPPAEAIQRAISLRPSGFLSLGLLTLILTPLLRVVGSLLVFAWERDGRYVLVTALVLIVMVVSLWIGQA